MMVERNSSRAVAAKHMICHLAISLELGSHRSLSKTLGIGRKNIRRILISCLLDDTSELFWNPPKRARRCDAILVKDRELVIPWWTIESTVFPNRKQIQCLDIGIRLYKNHPTHFLQKSQL